ncbi:MAG TPA: chemotaxis response regulator protein-glutamate methylesterase [Candidatus Acidoferrales bacterium]|nr:chemotaxis response regulator protein-glutamate methylesterase [Candidatus Acidoferrales bacterium]
MRVAIVNDMPMAVEALRRVVSGIPDFAVAWVAGNGAEALIKCAEDTPDLLLMDLVMPVMDGVEATRRIMARSPCAILIVTATLEGNSAKVVEALGAGALDAVQTPAVADSAGLGNENPLKSKMEAAARLISESCKNEQTSGVIGNGRRSFRNEHLVVIGASAGGPSALASVLKPLPRDFPAAVIIVQHIDEQFAPSMASWLDEQSALQVRVATERDKPQSGTVLVASSNDHLVFLDGHTIGYTKEPRDSYYRPSIDVFFESVVSHWIGFVTGVLLTGMGRDGAKGLKSLRDSGAMTIAQDAESCVVYGMPKAAAELGAAAQILPIPAIAQYLMKSLKRESQRRLA